MILESKFIQNAMARGKSIQEGRAETLTDRVMVYAAMAALKAEAKYYIAGAALLRLRVKLMTEHPALYLRASTALLKVKTAYVRLKCWLLEATVYMLTALRGY
jgi:hypothetical protein